MGWLAQQDGRGLTAVAIAPDLGERYLDTIYQSNWLQGLYGEAVLSPGEPAASARLPDPARRPPCPVPARTSQEKADH
jgi:cysteine synthase A